ncbi:MAG: thioredoxin family protein [Acidobacteria bacterium]|nr:MAG: thioredoxin family protein [Acidobacteriota bacterium]PIE89829.1 MAG: thioredoxin family protein [Acidobacteriota bacterium]
MVLTASTLAPLGSPAPDFNLLEPLTGEHRSLSECSGSSGTVVMFICNHCPYVIHIKEELVRITADYQAKGIGFVAINSNDVQSYPQDSPAKMIEYIQANGINFPYLFDQSQQVAKAYHAACTPDFFLYDGNFKLVYRGQLDDSSPGNSEPVNGYALRNAIEALINHQPMPTEQKPSMGCNIKWKK